MENKFELTYSDGIEFITDIQNAFNERNIKLPLRITLEIEKALTLYYYKKANIKGDSDEHN